MEHSSLDIFFVFPSTKHLLAGSVGGVCMTAVGHPFDTIKVRLQTTGGVEQNKAAPFSGALHCARKTITKEGFLALYKGAGTPFIISTPAWALCFYGFNLGKRLQTRKGRCSTESRELGLCQLFFAGMIGGLARQVILVPGERVKCLLQIQQSVNKYQGPLDCMRQIYRTEGYSGFYRGLCAAIARDIPMKGVFFMTYEWLLRNFIPKEQSRSDASPLQVIFVGGLAGIANWLVSLPQDVLKSRYITAPAGMYPRGIRDVFRETVREEGFRALWKGLAPVMARAFPSNAALFLGYEAVMKSIHLAEQKCFELSST